MEQTISKLKYLSRCDVKRVTSYFDFNCSDTKYTGLSVIAVIALLFSKSTGVTFILCRPFVFL